MNILKNSKSLTSTFRILYLIKSSHLLVFTKKISFKKFLSSSISYIEQHIKIHKNIRTCFIVTFRESYRNIIYTPKVYVYRNDHSDCILVPKKINSLHLTVLFVLYFWDLQIMIFIHHYNLE